MTFRYLWPFLAITFGLCWAIVAALLLIPELVTAVFGAIRASNPLFILAVYTPAIAALILVLKHSGVNGLYRFLCRFTLWKVSTGWYLLLIVGVPLLYYAGAALKGTLFTDPFPPQTWAAALPAIAFMLVLGPVEEFGWRGLALPLLQQRCTPFTAAIILGIIWGVWHLPAFFLSGTPQSAWQFTPFLIGSIAISVIVTPMFNASGGSILLPFLMHFQLNNPVFPDAQPHDTIMFVIAAMIVVILNRKSMFSREGAVTEVIPHSSPSTTTTESATKNQVVSTR